MADLLNAIDRRRSRRKYLPEPLDPSAANTLRAFITELTGREQIKMSLVTGNGDAFSGFRKSYGLFSGVRNYIALIGRKEDTLTLEKLGYYGEWLVLHATALGLGTCWVGGTFDRKSCPIELSDGESVVCAITVGTVPPELGAVERLIHSVTHRKSKSVEQMLTADGAVPDWCLSGMAAVQKAPSAVNRQPVHFELKDGAVSASVDNIAGEGSAFDLGIAKLHFELGAAGGSWGWGNGAAFRRNGS